MVVAVVSTSVAFCLFCMVDNPDTLPRGASELLSGCGCQCWWVFCSQWFESVNKLLMDLLGSRLSDSSATVQMTIVQVLRSQALKK